MYSVSGESNESISKAFEGNIKNIDTSISSLTERYDGLIQKRIELLQPVHSSSSREESSTPESAENAGNFEVLKQLLELRSEMYDFLSHTTKLRNAFVSYSENKSGSFRWAKFFNNHFSTNTLKCHNLSLQLRNELNEMSGNLDFMENYASVDAGEFEFMMIERRLISLKNQINELKSKYLDNLIFFMEAMKSITVTRVDILSATEEAKREVMSP